MANEKPPEPKATVRMKYMGHFTGTKKVVQLPIPLVSQSQKLDDILEFTRTSSKQGPGYCDVPMEWVGALLAVGGNWQSVDVITPALKEQIASAKVVSDARMAKFALENELVEA